MTERPRLSWEKRRKLLKSQGTWDPEEPIGPVREHVKAVMKAGGLSIAQFAELAGMPRSTVSVVLGRQDRKNVKKATAKKIWSVPVGSAAVTGYVPSAGSTRRLQALSYAGHPMMLVAARTGLDIGWLRKLRAGTAEDRVRRATAQVIAVTCREMLQASPSALTRTQRIAAARTRRSAAEAGWVSYWAWDDIDNPREVPQAGVVRLPAPSPPRKRRKETVA